MMRINFFLESALARRSDGRIDGHGMMPWLGAVLPCYNVMDMPISRILIVLSVIVLPQTAAAYIIETDYKYPQIHRAAASSESSISSVSPASSLSPEQIRRNRNQGFWADTMNYRKDEASFLKAHAERRLQRRNTRLECRTKVRKANRGAMVPITLKCYRSTLQTELEILRKEKQYVQNVPGPLEQYRIGAVAHIDNLADAITITVNAIDNGAYETKEAVQEAKKSLAATYRNNKRLAMTKLRISRSIAWINHLIIRIDDLPDNASSAEKRGLATACFAESETGLLALLEQEDNDALIADFRQEQSNLKYCIESAREVEELNTELRQVER